MKGKTEKGELNIPINSTSLREYLNQKFKPINGLQYTTDFEGKEIIIEEIKNYGLETLLDFEKIIPQDIFKNYKIIGEKLTPMAFVRDVLIINDFKKYFEQSYADEWIFTGSKEDFEIFEKYGFSIDQFQNVMI